MSKPQHFTFHNDIATKFKFHVGHDSSLSVKFDDGREVDIDLDKIYDFEQFGRIIGHIPDVFIVKDDAAAALLAALQRKED